jgi:DNA modification methylase
MPIHKEMDRGGEAEPRAKERILYFQFSDWMICALRAGMKQAGLYYSQLIIWVKNNIVLGRKDYNPQHELIAYGWFGAHKFERGKAKASSSARSPRRQNCIRR